eukprot:CAMPEP_0197623730 /NCGR_PEP_ID=MMETSP1338-20131121/3684_1 /TAXON_ID=43686 ORGANISM="Pelagodinium beii, Strain RCC1491" /NCGR_SAMPLE_ID=MMETSP1338 /ASSEMBLY_ACC=CAM_ASM_000754 /LENGTH=210 /DNA_ID=CAMNT_0043193795 /DNA_START=63 /DNA_END=695 /DNA_ORIENTATION=+
MPIAVEIYDCLRAFFNPKSISYAPWDKGKLDCHEFYYEEFLLKKMPIQQSTSAHLGDHERASFIDRAKGRAERASNIIRTTPKQTKPATKLGLICGALCGVDETNKMKVTIRPVLGSDFNILVLPGESVMNVHARIKAMTSKLEEDGRGRIPGCESESVDAFFIETSTHYLPTQYLITLENAGVKNGDVLTMRKAGSGFSKPPLEPPKAE